MLNRKNALFAGHDQGAESWAAIASLYSLDLASLLRRRAHKARQSLACIAPRRAHALELDSTAFRRLPSSLRREAIGGTLCCPTPRHELVEARCRPEIDELCEHVGEVGLRIDTIQFAGLDK